MWASCSLCGQRAERQEARFQTFAAETATVEDHTVREETTEISGTRKISADACGSNTGSASVALEAEATDKTAGLEHNAQELDCVSVCDAQQNFRDGSRDQTAKEGFDELFRPLRQPLGEILDP